MSADANIAVIVLAAGGSTRLGRPKQLVQFKGETLLEHTLKQVNMLGFQRKVLVLGSRHEEILGKIDANGYQVVVNSDWEQGMASSIKLGLKARIRPALFGTYRFNQTGARPTHQKPERHLFQIWG